MNKTQEKAILVGITRQEETAAITKEHLDELQLLAETAGAKILRRFTQNMDRANPKFFVGPGKLDEIATYAKDNEVDLVIFDNELTNPQIRNIELKVECKIIDRTNLILDIFAARAQTSQARTQVELAQCQYLLPRLTRMWTHLSRQKGGIGMKGPGETEIETDRRVIRTKITLLKEKLKKIDQQTVTRRKTRDEKVRVSLVGYTNAGKSTLMNLLSKESVLAEDKLFATLDTTVRKVVLGDMPFLLSDTVGFIRKLPHSLVESFKSTLDEVKEADILLHLVDISHPYFQHHIEVVNATLNEIKAGGKPTLLVLNKLDDWKATDEEGNEIISLPEKEKLFLSSMEISTQNTIIISCNEKFNIDNLKQRLAEEVKDMYRLIYPYKYAE